MGVSYTIPVILLENTENELIGTCSMH